MIANPEQADNLKAVAAFDATAAQFAAALDSQIRRTKFVRGELFSREVRRRVPAGGTILDYGCGPGRLARAIAVAGYRVLGVDRSVSMIEQSRRLPAVGGNLRFELDGEAGQWQMPDAYDAIVCSSVIEYVRDYMQVLSSFRRCLVPGGWLILSFANRSSLWVKYYNRYHGNTSPHTAVRYNFWTWRQCRRILEQTGFTSDGSPRYYESILDTLPAGTTLSRLRLIGSLGIIAARKTAG